MLENVRMLWNICTNEIWETRQNVAGHLCHRVCFLDTLHDVSYGTNFFQTFSDCIVGVFIICCFNVLFFNEFFLKIQNFFCCIAVITSILFFPIRLAIEIQFLSILSHDYLICERSTTSSSSNTISLFPNMTQHSQVTKQLSFMAVIPHFYKL